jgi:hypothetical protein
MNSEGESVIEEYLVLVREKLPESIADDVISELRSYMHESARDQGNGEITIQSAKKVVAQFGAPGEVADEYRYSMFPETIPVEAVPEEIVQEPQQIVEQEPVKQPKPMLTPIPQQDPSVSYRSFFLTASFQSIVWIIITSLLTLFTGPIGFPGWTLLIPVSQVGLVIGALFLQSLNLRWDRTILWRRAYREWSALQNYVTLPENSVPEMGRNMLGLDALASFLGIILFTAASLFSSPIFFVFCGIPICLLLGARIYYRAVTFRDEKDPIRNSRIQFVINIALLVGLNASLFWIFGFWGYWSYTLWSWGLLLLPYIVGYGSILLMNIVTGAQNLWWKTEDGSKEIRTPGEEVSAGKKAELLARLPGNIGHLFAGVALWIFIYNLPQIFISFDNSTFDFISSDMSRWIIHLPVEIVIAGVLLVCYFVYRRVLISKFSSKTVFGNRTRIEALADSIISLFFCIIILPLVFIDVFYSNIFNEILIFQRHLGIRWAMISELMQIVTFPLIAIGLIFRIIGDILEFRSSSKERATGLIEQSAILIILGLTIFSASEFLFYIAITHFYSSFFMSDVILLPVVMFLSFQFGSSSLKGKISKVNGKSQSGKSIKSNNVFSSIAN